MSWESYSRMQLPLKGVQKFLLISVGAVQILTGRFILFSSLMRRWLDFWKRHIYVDCFVGIDLCNEGDPALPQCGQIIYCCCPSVFFCKILNLALQAGYVRIHECLSRCERPINMGLYASKEYDSIWKYFVVVSDITAAVANSRLSIKRTKNTQEKERIPTLEGLNSALTAYSRTGPLKVWMW